VKPQRPLSAAGQAAAHSPALFRQRAEEVDLLPEFGRMGERFARVLGPILAALGGGKMPDVRLAHVERNNGGELGGKISPLAANCVYAIGTGKHRLLLSIDGAALLAQLDRAFGGTGEVTSPLPETLPLSADLLAQRLEAEIATLLGQVISPNDELVVAERETAYATLAPFRKAEPLAVLSFEICDAGSKPWTMLLAVKAETLSAIVPSPHASQRTPRRRAGPLDDPFADISLTLEAVLTEMRVPLSRIAALAPGQTIPIPVPRAMPLRIGGTVIAKGTVGELEDRVALQLTSALLSRKDSQ
jgi:flagellar motor switch protein FliM